MNRSRRPRLAVWKFASCDGCQLTLLDCEDELLAVAEQVEIGYFLEASSAIVEGPYDLSLVEGSITTEHDAARIRDIRDASRRLVTIGGVGFPLFGPTPPEGIKLLVEFVDDGEATLTPDLAGKKPEDAVPTYMDRHDGVTVTPKVMPATPMTITTASLTTKKATRPT